MTKILKIQKLLKKQQFILEKLIKEQWGAFLTSFIEVIRRFLVSRLQPCAM